MLAVVHPLTHLILTTLKNRYVVVLLQIWKWRPRAVK